MNTKLSRTASILWAAASLALPAILVLGAYRTYRALDDQRTVYLRGRMASIAAMLETAPATLEEEPGLLGLSVLPPPAEPASDPLAPLWEGRELYRTEFLTEGGQPVFRAVVPFHAAEGLRLARLDLDASEADFLTRDAGRHLVLVCVGSLLFLGLSAFTFRSLRRQMELEHLAQIGTMSAVLAHEIRNPLGTIKGFAQLLLEKAAPAQKPLLDPILNESLRLESLVRDLLLYGRPSQPEMRLVRARDLAATLGAHTPGPPVFEADVPDVTFSSDPNLLEQALLNLIRNALEATGSTPSPRVTLRVRETARHIVWSVQDNGPGLPPEVQRHLFQPFRTTKTFGTGLGLSISRKLAAALGGRLSLANQAEGGVAAEIQLPGKK